MKLSESILLGSTLLAAKGGAMYFRETEEGCALGMAGVASGCTFGRVTQPFLQRDRRTLGVEGVWGDWVLRIVMRTCDCAPAELPREMRIKDVITHLFDYHVMTRKDWTLERLVNWVQTWEPKEAPDPDTLFSEQERARQEMADWQETRRAFAARQHPRTTRRPPRL